MCYNTSIIRKKEELEKIYKIKALIGDLEEDSELIYNSANGFSHPHMWIIPQERPNNMIPVMWGLIPHYKLGKDAKNYYKETIKYGSGLNAKSEKLFDSNNYKGSALTRRCIIPVDGFFEPHRIENVSKPYSIPFYFERKDNKPFNLAGIYAVTPDEMVTFTILTKEATPLFAKIHNKKKRRPVILNDSGIDLWLDNTLTEKAIKEVMGNDMKDSDMNAYPISLDLYKRNGEGDRDDITERVDYKDLEIDYSS